MARWNDLVIQEGVLYMEVPPTERRTGPSLRLVAVSEIRKKLLKLLHNPPLCLGPTGLFKSCRCIRDGN